MLKKALNGKFDLGQQIKQLGGVKGTGIGRNEKPIDKTQNKENMIKRLQRMRELPLLVPIRSSISIYSSKDIEQISVNKIINGSLTGSGSVNDPFAGTVSLSETCGFCGNISCPSHYQYIDLNVPLCNPMFIREIVAVLASICKCCYRPLLPKTRAYELGILELKGKNRLFKIEEESKGVECTANNDPIEGGPIAHCENRQEFITTELRKTGKITYRLAGKQEESKKKQIFSMSMEKVKEILDGISDEDAEFLGFASDNHPRNLIMEKLIVIPPIARPPATTDGVVQHDQLTLAYVKIFKESMNVKNFIEGNPKKKGKSEEKNCSASLDNAIKCLYTSIYELIFKTEGHKMGNKAFLSIIEKIQGKEAHIRSSLLGKRTNYSARTVSGCEPALPLGTVRHPRCWAPVLTKPVKITDLNYHKVQEWMKDGLITDYTNRKSGLRHVCTEGLTYNFKIGDTVSRYSKDGDYTIINRQPSLHKYSMMAHKIKLGDQLTIGIQLSICGAMNNDFDGDENGSFPPQNLQTEAEAMFLLDVRENIMSSEQNRPVITLVMNAVLGFYLLSQKGVFIEDRLFNIIIGMLSNKNSIPTLYERLEKYGVHPRSGAALISALLPEDFTYSGNGITIFEGIFVDGVLSKKHVGGAHRSLIQEIWKNYGQYRTADFITDASWLTNRWIIEEGFTISLKDCADFGMRDGVLYNKNDEVVKGELAKMYNNIDSLEKGESAEEKEFLERQIIGSVNVASEIGQLISKKINVNSNGILMMTNRGSGMKGEEGNIGQIMGCAGQQFYRKARFQPSITSGTRSLPYFDAGDISPEAKGFVKHSFFQGMSPVECFWLQKGGRESLLDTGVNVQETGALQRKMIKGAENIVIANDGSIRNTIGKMLAPIFNSGYAIEHCLNVKNEYGDDVASFIDVKGVITELNVKRGWIPKSHSNLIKSNIENYREVKFTPYEKEIEIKTDNAFRNVLNTKRLSRFEKARLIGTRAEHIANNAPPTIDVGEEYDSLKIAILEYEQGKCPLHVIRRYPNGKSEIIYPTLEFI